jgi:hypothetical protein
VKHAVQRGISKAEFLLNNIFKFGSYLKGNTIVSATVNTVNTKN